MSIFKSKYKETTAVDAAYIEAINTDIPETEETGKKSGRMTLREFFTDYVLPFAIAVFVFTVIMEFAVVSGHSMDDTLADGQLTLFWKLGYEPQRGDIVIINDKDHLGYRQRLVKRVIAIEGDTIDIDFNTGCVYLNGELLQEDYIAEPTYTNEGMEFPLTIEEGHVFVMGDNRNHSGDSRDPRIGQIEESCVTGKYLFTVPLLRLPHRTEG